MLRKSVETKQKTVLSWRLLKRNCSRQPRKHLVSRVFCAPVINARLSSSYCSPCNLVNIASISAHLSLFDLCISWNFVSLRSETTRLWTKHRQQLKDPVLIVENLTGNLWSKGLWGTLKEDFTTSQNPGKTKQVEDEWLRGNYAFRMIFSRHVNFPERYFLRILSSFYEKTYQADVVRRWQGLEDILTLIL